MSLTPEEIASIPSRRLPISPQLAHLVSEFTSLSIQLFTILSTSNTNSTPALLAPIYESLSVVDAKLSSLVKLVALHQQRQHRIDQLVESLSTLSTSTHSSTTTLNSCISLLEPIVTSGRLDRESIHLSQSSSTCTTTALLSYARLLAPFTSAPPSSLFPPRDRLSTKGLGATDPTGRSLPPGSIPPFPTEGVMRRGRLQFGREGVADALGETGEIGVRREGQELHPTTTGAQGGGGSTTMDQLQYEAKQYESNQQNGVGGGTSNNFTNGHGMEGGKDQDDEEEEGEEEQFEFDLDLNPDL